MTEMWHFVQESNTGTSVSCWLWTVSWPVDKKGYGIRFLRTGFRNLLFSVICLILCGSGIRCNGCISKIQSSLKQIMNLECSVLLEVFALLGYYTAFVCSYRRFGMLCRSHILRYKQSNYSSWTAINNQHCVTSQKSEDLNHTAAEAWNLALYSCLERISPITEKVSDIRSISGSTRLKTNSSWAQFCLNSV
jgi:hypothetical protein